uniref:J domain-containing protein n=1 Tax=Alexandrium monilatum TaxID=311494 RepID=A0A7S4RQQ8_9DINO
MAQGASLAPRPQDSQPGAFVRSAPLGATAESRPRTMWPVVLAGMGLGALATRQGLRVLQRSGVKMELPAFKFGGLGSLRRESLQGFESPMTRIEARNILNLRELNPTKDTIRESHRKLLVANHPDKGGSTYIASKINEAKEVLLGRKAV